MDIGEVTAVVNCTVYQQMHQDENKTYSKKLAFTVHLTSQCTPLHTATNETLHLVSLLQITTENFHRLSHIRTLCRKVNHPQV